MIGDEQLVSDEHSPIAYGPLPIALKKDLQTEKKILK
jgi:hypothetical protein